MGEFKDKMLTMMKVYGLSERTQKMYLNEMKKFVGYFMIAPDKMTKDHIFKYQDYMINKMKAGHSSIKIMVNSLRFFYNKVVNYDYLIKYLPYQKKDQNYQLF